MVYNVAPTPVLRESCAETCPMGANGSANAMRRKLPQALYMTKLSFGVHARRNSCLAPQAIRIILWRALLKMSMMGNSAAAGSAVAAARSLGAHGGGSGETTTAGGKIAQSESCSVLERAEKSEEKPTKVENTKKRTKAEKKESAAKLWKEFELRPTSGAVSPKFRPGGGYEAFISVLQKFAEGKITQTDFTDEDRRVVAELLRIYRVINEDLDDEDALTMYALCQTLQDMMAPLGKCDLSVDYAAQQPGEATTAALQNPPTDRRHLRLGISREGIFQFLQEIGACDYLPGVRAHATTGSGTQVGELDWTNAVNDLPNWRWTGLAGAQDVRKENGQGWMDEQCGRIERDDSVAGGFTNVVGYDLANFLRSWLLDNGCKQLSVCEAILLKPELQHLRKHVKHAEIFWSHMQQEPFLGEILSEFSGTDSTGCVDPQLKVGAVASTAGLLREVLHIRGSAAQFGSRKRALTALAKLQGFKKNYGDLRKIDEGWRDASGFEKHRRMMELLSQWKGELEKQSAALALFNKRTDFAGEILAAEEEDFLNRLANQIPIWMDFFCLRQCVSDFDLGTVRSIIDLFPVFVAAPQSMDYTKRLFCTYEVFSYDYSRELAVHLNRALKQQDNNPAVSVPFAAPFAVPAAGAGSSSDEDDNAGAPQVWFAQNFTNDANEIAKQLNTREAHTRAPVEEKLIHWFILKKNVLGDIHRLGVEEQVNRLFEPLSCMTEADVVETYANFDRRVAGIFEEATQ